MRLLLIFIWLAFFVSAKGQSYFRVPEAKDTAQFNKGLVRTAGLLTSATKANCQEVRILVYGQSISEQIWWLDLKAFVAQQFPLADIIFTNKAIGGFSADRLKLMVENDVSSFYPDLVLFHDYGNEADYETIIQIIRERTTAEIAVQTDHMAMQNQEWHDRHSEVWLPAICRKYGLALIDVRGAWKTYLKEHGLAIGDLLVDGVHLNAHGNYLMAGIMKKYFAMLRPVPPVDLYVKTLIAGKDFTIKGSGIDVPFNGNRVDLIWNENVHGQKPVHLFIDGKKPSLLNGCYYYTRPALDNVGFLKKIGQVLAMRLNGDAREEAWTMTITAADSAKQQVQFTLQGSLTGEDGIGTSERTFTSRSERIVIDSTHWFRASSFANFLWIKPGDVIRWEVRCMCKDAIIPQSSAFVTVVQGISNGQHRLQLAGKGLEGLQAIRVYKPALQ